MDRLSIDKKPDLRFGLRAAESHHRFCGDFSQSVRRKSLGPLAIPDTESTCPAKSIRYVGGELERTD